MKEIMYRSTRSNDEAVLPSVALLRGLAPDGGLYVPTKAPSLVDIAENLGIDSAGDASSIGAAVLDALSAMNYKGVAYEVLRVFLTDYTEDELRACVDGAYDEKFDTDVIAPLIEKAGVNYLELFHGATIAFKDMALSILPHLMTTAAKKQGVTDEIVILTATSGDTGKAALAGFADVPGTRIMVFYPKNGVSPVQEKQMVTQRGNNVRVIGITGNFDDAQSGVKELFSDKELEAELASRGYRFSSANSINIGRLVPQVAYYVWSYVQLMAAGKIQNGDKINVTVPTGNFGNILAGYYAKKMGVPINMLVCASNENRVLYDFFGSGTYDKNREFKLTSSPSMDILISSNLERLIFETVGSDADKCEKLMKALKEEGKYELSEDEKETLASFVGGWADEAGTAEEIKRVYTEASYVIDTHTAVASKVAHSFIEGSEQLKAVGIDSTLPMVVVSTASPFKFTRSVMSAIDKKYEGMEDFALIDELSSLTGLKVPQAIEDIRSAPVLHDIVCDKEEMKDEVLGFLR